MTLVRRSLLGIACVAALAACKGREIDRDGNQPRNFDKDDKAGTTTITGAEVTMGSLSTELALQRIVAARCLRETSCNNVGSDKHFTNHDVCARELRSRMVDDLKASECPHGISAKELDECMDAIHTESCNNPVDTISRLAACRTSSLCTRKDP